MAIVRNIMEEIIMEEILPTLKLILYRIFIKIGLFMTRYLPCHTLIKAIHSDKAIEFVD